MADLTLTARTPLDGAEITIGENRIRERTDLALVSAAIPQGGDAAFEKALKSGLGLAMPDARLSSSAKGGARAIRSAPDQLLLLLEHDIDAAEAHVQTKLKGTAYTTDQTGGWVMIELSGPGCHAALERLCPLDLDPSAFPDRAAARTVMEHMSAVILRLGADNFLLLSASSSARSFLHAVETSFAYTA